MSYSSLDPEQPCRPPRRIQNGANSLIFNEWDLRRILKSYFEYDEKSRTHLGLAKDAPIPRPVQPPSLGRVIALPQVGGLHHRYERRAALKFFHRTKTRILADLFAHLKRTPDLVSARVPCSWPPPDSASRSPASLNAASIEKPRTPLLRTFR